MLLTNGGFEEGYRPLTAPDGSKPHHKAWVYEVDTTGGPITKRYTVERGEIHNPVAWWSWYAHQRNDETPVPWDPANRIGWAEPEIRLSEPVHQRHRSGERAGYAFTWRRIHEGGLFQQVQVEVGRRLRFAAFGHAWISNDDSQPPSCSLPGCGPLWWKAGTPGLSDDQRSVRLSVGIDPTGGVDPYAATVIWGDEWHIFNGYRDEPLWVEAVAESNTVTVFLRSSTLWPVIHNDVAWDDCSLEYIDDEWAPGQCRGAPRVQYERTFNVLAPDMSETRAVQIFRQCFSQRQTVGFSPDDAGLGDLDVKRAVLWDFPAAEHDIYRNWFAEHYPGTLVMLEGQAPDDPLKLTYPTTHLPAVITSPYGPRGANFHYGVDLRSSWSVWRDELIAALDGEVILTGIEPGKAYFGQQVQIRAFHAGEEVILRYAHLVPEADGGIYVSVGQRVMRGAKLGRPDNTGTSTGDHLHFDARINGQYVNPEGLIEWPEEAQPPLPPSNPEPGRILGLHLQDWGDMAAVLEFVERAKPSVIKIFEPGMAAAQILQDGNYVPGIKARSPQTKIVYRHCLTREQELGCLDDPEGSAKWFLDQFAEQVRPYVERGEITHIETAINEVMDGYRVADAIAFELAFIAELQKRLPLARPVVATIAVGNPEVIQYPLMVPLAKAIAKAGGAFGYHSYWPVEAGRSYLESDWEWHAGRFEGMDALFRQNGYAVDWILSECGPCGGRMQTTDEGGRWFAYDPKAGWRHPQCFGGDWDKALQDLEIFRRRLSQSPARVIGATLFTVCPWDWAYFNLDKAQIDTL